MTRRRGQAVTPPGPPPVRPEDRERDVVERPGALELHDARLQLIVHRLDPEQRTCAACGDASPCPAANAAAEAIVAAGDWSAMGFDSPHAVRAAAQERESPVRRAARALARALGLDRGGDVGAGRVR